MNYARIFQRNRKIGGCQALKRVQDTREADFGGERVPRRLTLHVSLGNDCDAALASGELTWGRDPPKSSAGTHDTEVEVGDNCETVFWRQIPALSLDQLVAARRSALDMY